MSFTTGTRIGPYEITSPLGEGGMGVVYRAHDTKLGRDVAIKALPDAFASDADRLQRFQREAQVLASLNHPNIAQIYGLEESARTRCIVMELVEGETLQERLKRGPIPVDETLLIAKQIAEALEAAHERGIIHRDLKPANIKISPDGKVKVLDFGLAKALQEQQRSDLSHSPTLLSAASSPGVILGTAAYMSPEQARGAEADHRSDLFSFGVVLYEMLTGKQVFQGDTVSDVLASVLKTEPDLNLLPNINERTRELLHRCLEKNPKERWQAVGDLRIEVNNILAIPAEQTQEITPRIRREWVWKAIAGTAIVALIATVVALAPRRTMPAPAPLRINGDLGADVSLAADALGNSALALSPDGLMMAFVGAKGGIAQIYVRPLGQLQATPLAGTAGAQSPFFSPDGQWIGFFAEGKLKKIAVTGGAAVTLADAPNGRGGSWANDDKIYFSPNTPPGTPLQWVSSSGGKVQALTKPAREELHRWPQILPGAKAVLYSLNKTGTNLDIGEVIAQPLPSGNPNVLVEGGYHAQFLPDGHLVYVHDGTLFAAPFDLDRLQLTAQAVPAIEGVASNNNTGAVQFAVSQTGAVTYLAGSAAGVDTPVFWVNHDGKTTPLRAMASAWTNPRFSPDGQKLALDMILAGNFDIWVYEWARDTLTRFTFDPSSDEDAVWTPDGKRIVFASSRGKGPLNLYWQRADGTGEVQRLTESPNNQIPSSFHPNGKYLAYFERTQNNLGLMILPIEGDELSGWKPGTPSVFLNTPAVEQEPMFSPDGRWIAYASNESSRTEIFVRPFPGPGGKWQISTGGGFSPTWSKAHRELLYRAPDQRIMVVPYTVNGDSFQADKPRLWSEQPILLLGGGVRSFDLHPDGERIAAAVPSGQPQEKLGKVTFIFNFFDELRRIAPPSKK